MKHALNAFLTLVLAGMLVLLAAYLPSPAITEDARARHMETTVDDDYSFLFE